MGVAELSSGGNRLGDCGEGSVVSGKVSIDDGEGRATISGVFENNFFSRINVLTTIGGVTKDQIKGDGSTGREIKNSGESLPLTGSGEDECIAS